MELAIALQRRSQVQEFQRRHRIGLLTLLFTDIVGSTRLKQRWGDMEAVAMIQRHHDKVREILRGFKEGELISTGGDSCFLVFAKPSDAVKFALLLQSHLQAQARQSGHPVFDRIGIHVGEVFIEEVEGQPKPKDLYGMQVDTCARVMSLANENQILVSRFAFDNARQVLKGQDLNGVGPVSWLNHGPYLLKGVEEPVEICEVGETGKAALTAPASSEKAQRFLSANAEPVLGWRPAVGQTVPGTNWTLQEKLGEGGFGEVWLAWHEVLKQKRVFKFCFRADRVRSLKREVTLFRLLRDKVGQHPNVMALREVYFDEPPYYLVMDYAGGKDLVSWCEAHGAARNVPLNTRLEIIAQIADGLHAAHQAGVVHRDIKPSNILLVDDPNDPAKIQVLLSDFGIGQIVSSEALEGLTRAGFTETMLSSSSSQSGTLMYMAPELIAGKASSPQSDIYSLGVLLYQLAVGDFAQPLTMDWVRHVDDPLLQDDLVKCFAGNPESRFRTAGELAASLREMEQRGSTRAAEQAKLEAANQRAYLFALLRKAAVAVLLVGMMITIFFLLKNAQGAKLGAIEISSVPEGAEVWQNGQRIGSTPYYASALTPGEFSFSLKLTNFESLLDEKIHVRPRETRTVIAPLRPLQASSMALSLTNVPTKYLAAIEFSPHLLNLTNEVAAAPSTAPPPMPNGKPPPSAHSGTNLSILEPVRLAASSHSRPPDFHATSKAFDATIVTIENRVEICRKGETNWTRAEPNAVLKTGDRLRTGQNSRATVRFVDWTTMRVSELSTIEINRPLSPGRDSYYFDRNKPKDLRLKTPHVEAAVKG